MHKLNNKIHEFEQEFFYNVRRQCRHLAILGLNTWYLPLSVGMFTTINTVRCVSQRLSLSLSLSLPLSLSLSLSLSLPLSPEVFWR